VLWNNGSVISQLLTSLVEAYMTVVTADRILRQSLEHNMTGL